MFHVICFFLVKFAPGKKQSFAILSYVNLILEIIKKKANENVMSLFL